MIKKDFTHKKVTFCGESTTRNFIKKASKIKCKKIEMRARSTRASVKPILLHLYVININDLLFTFNHKYKESFLENVIIKAVVPMNIQR